MTTIEKEVLYNLLTLANIPIHKWGTGYAKTFNHLAKEVEEHEAKIDYKDGRVVRRIKVMLLDIYYIDERNCTWKLVEENQVFGDGRSRPRNLNTSVSEKMIGQEPGIAALTRALKKELQITSSVNAVFLKQFTNVGESTSYPGLITISEKFLYRVILNKEQYRPEGYVEKQEGLRTYFVWKQIPSIPDDYTVVKRKG